MVYRYIYKITCTAGSYKNKFYFGQHTTTNLHDVYKGSGVKLRSYYKKHPNDYIKEIISFHTTDEELNKAEYEIIHPWLNNKMCLNLMEGGALNALKSNETKQKISLALTGKKHSAIHILHNRERHIGQIAWNKGLVLGPLSDTCKEKISKQISNKKWMNKDGINKRVPLENISLYLEKGFILGRVFTPWNKK